MIGIEIDPKSGVFVKQPNIGINMKRALNIQARLINREIKKQMLEPKHGNYNPNTRRRRSAIGEGLAKDTGESTKLITTSEVNSRYVQGGFLNNPTGDNYIAKHEEMGRETVRLALESSVQNNNNVILNEFDPGKW